MTELRTEHSVQSDPRAPRSGGGPQIAMRSSMTVGFVGAIVLGTLPAWGFIPCDVVTLKDGQELECLVVEVDQAHVKLLRGSEGISESRRLPLSEVSAIRLAPPDVSGLRSVAR